MKYRLARIISIFFLTVSVSSFSDAINYEKAKQIIVSVVNDTGNNFLGYEINYEVFHTDYFHNDFIWVPGDSLSCEVVGKKIRFEDTYYVYDDVNYINPHEERLLVVVISYYLAGYIHQNNSMICEYKPKDEVVLSKYYFSFESGDLQIIDIRFHSPAVTFISSALEWAANSEYKYRHLISNNMIPELMKTKANFEINDNRYVHQNSYNFYNIDIMKRMKPNEYWISKSENLHNQAKTYANERHYDVAVSYLKEAIYGNPKSEYYYELAELLFEQNQYIESMHSYNISAQLGYNPVYFAYYNAACAASMAELIDEGFDYLKKALDAGYSYLSHIEKDEDIQYLRNMRGFNEIIERYK